MMQDDEIESDAWLGGCDHTLVITSEILAVFVQYLTT